MLSKNFWNNEVAFSALAVPAVRTADAQSSGLDVQGAESAILVADVGNSGDTLSGSVLIDLELQESDDDSTYTACADADLENPDTGAAGAVTGTTTGTFARIDAPAEDSLLVPIRYVGTKRYVRVNMNLTGTHTNGTPVGVFGMLARKNYV